LLTLGDLPRRQQDVNDLIMSVGGYWTLSAAAVRLLEEIGEFSEIYPPTQGIYSKIEMEGELADLYIITTCIANQHLIALPEPAAEVSSNLSPAELLRDLIIRAGRIARIVNYYDGPKRPRTMDGWESLETAITAFHRSLGRVALDIGIRLEDAVANKLVVARGKDRGRFAASFDPVTSEIIAEFSMLTSSRLCPYAKNARVWGARKCRHGEHIGEYVRETSPDFMRFLKCALVERLDGFIFGFEHSATPNLADLSVLLRDFLLTVSGYDSPSNNCFQGEVRVRGWQFSIAGIRLFVSVFSNVYDQTHPRYSQDSTFIFLQPEESFSWHSIGSQYAGSESRHRKVRERFLDAGYWYPSELIDRRIEADLYILPPGPEFSPVIWWS